MLTFPHLKRYAETMVSDAPPSSSFTMTDAS